MTNTEPSDPTDQKLSTDLTILKVVINARARPDQSERANAALMKIVNPIRKNPDCISFHVYRDADDPRLFILFEEWKSKEALFLHGKRDYMKEYMAQKDILFEELSGGFFQEVEPLDVIL